MKQLDPQEFKIFQKLVMNHTSIHMAENKATLLSNRIAKRLKELQLETYLDYYHFLNSNKGKDEIYKFIDAVTTNETYFFRADKIWNYYSNLFLPQWHQDNKNSTLKIWCGAASSGEEPYTIAICNEEFSKKQPNFQWDLKASDISTEMLAKCENATYFEYALKKTPKPIIQQYFDGTINSGAKIKPTIKRKIKFFQHKLQNPPIYKGFDIALIRNVMIYFDRPTKELVLQQVHQSLKPNGILIIGESEGLNNVPCAFKYIQPSIYQKIDN